MGEINKTAKIAVGMVITVAILLIVAFVIVGPGSKILWSTKSSIESLGPSKCTAADKSREIKDFYDDIKLYGMRTREGSSDANELYDPELALSGFKTYIACKKENMFTKKDLEEYDKKIMADSQAIYGYFAEDICNEQSVAVTKGADKDKINALKDKYENLVDDYYDSLGDDAPAVKTC